MLLSSVPLSINFLISRISTTVF